MKKAVFLAAAAVLVAAQAVAAEDEEKCKTEIPRADNPVLEFITIPFKMVAAFSHLPRCAIDNFPVNEEK